MIFGKHINRYYLKYAPQLLLGAVALILVDYVQLIIPELYRMLINGLNEGQVDGVPFNTAFLLDRICLPIVFVILVMVVGRFCGASAFSARRSAWRRICASRCSTTARTFRASTIR